MADLGWSYPAGCSGVPDDEPCGCEVCGKDVDNCQCEECPVCKTIGDPTCQTTHGHRHHSNTPTKWVTFTRRTDDPKLTWLEGKLDFLSIPHRRNGFSWHAPILEVPANRLEECEAMLDEEIDMGDGTTMTLDEMDDDDRMFLEPY